MALRIANLHDIARRGTSDEEYVYIFSIGKANKYRRCLPDRILFIDRRRDTLAVEDLTTQML